MPKIQVYLNNPQRKKFEAKLPFQMSHPQLEAGQGIHHVEIEMLPHHYRDLLTKAHHKKGFRFSPEVVQGGSMVGSVLKGAKWWKTHVPKEVTQELIKIGADTAAQHYGKELGPSHHKISDALVDYSYSGKGVNESLVHTSGFKLKQINSRPSTVTRAIKQPESVISGCQQQFFGGDILGNAEHYLGFGSGHRIHVKHGNLVNGIATPIFSQEKLHQIARVGRRFHQIGTGNGLMHGGSFLAI
jgi:hypothetical protein